MGKIREKALKVFKQKIYLSKKSDLNLWPKTQRGCFPKMDMQNSFTDSILLFARATGPKNSCTKKTPAQKCLKNTNKQAHMQVKNQ